MHADWLNEEFLEHAQAESAGGPMCVCVWGCAIEIIVYYDLYGVCAQAPSIIVIVATISMDRSKDDLHAVNRKRATVQDTESERESRQFPVLPAY